VNSHHSNPEPAICLPFTTVAALLQIVMATALRLDISYKVSSTGQSLYDFVEHQRLR
jgi:hypothetical protein